jgi:hypothetical protein
MRTKKGTSAVIGTEQETLGRVGPVNNDTVRELTQVLTDYKNGKKSLDERIIENEKWYKLHHWDVMRKKQTNNTDPEPASAWLFNTIANKHADAMDNYPEQIALPRQRDDEEQATMLSSVLPVVFERNEFEDTYDKAWWYKLKHGTSCYGIFWDTSLENGLGDIAIRKIDLLNLFWEPGITDIQASSRLFVVDLIDNEVLKMLYPFLEGKLTGNPIEIGKYQFDDTVDTSKKSLVVDCYYKKAVSGVSTVHIIKFVSGELIYASENDPSYATTGIYEHGLYPLEFDILFPEEGTPHGFGYVDICKDPQMYIDKLDQIIAKNALMAGKKRWFVKKSTGVNVTDYADWSKDFVECNNLDEQSFKEIQISPLDTFIVQHKVAKIEELKETAGNRDFSQGGTAGGVTAASAIAALQEAGNKLSRDMIKGSYRVFNKLNLMAIELIRQFYDEQRQFRITGANGDYAFVQFDNSGIKPQQIAVAPQIEPMLRKPVFDIKIKAQRTNPFSRMAQNELMLQLYKLGMFNPQQADGALIALDGMDFEGKEKVIEAVRGNAQLAQQLQQAMQMISTMQGGVPDGPGQVPMEGQNVMR